MKKLSRHLRPPSVTFRKPYQDVDSSLKVWGSGNWSKIEKKEGPTVGPRVFGEQTVLKNSFVLLIFFSRYQQFLGSSEQIPATGDLDHLRKAIKAGKHGKIHEKLRIVPHL